jgi:hypothetical protein
MDPLLQFILALAIIVVAAKGSGYLSNRLGQPAVLGELLVGLVLGPTVLNMLHWPTFGDQHLGENLSHHTCLAFRQSVRECSPRFRLRIGQAGLLVAYSAALW